MGSLNFFSRKLSLQTKVNNYNAQLQQLSNKENQITNQQAANQQGMNLFTSFTNANGTEQANNAQNAQQQKLNLQQKQIDTEKQRITTLLQKAQKELESVEKAEDQAQKRETPKYTA